MENSNAKILYAEDDETLSFITKDNLELKGYKIDFAPDGEEALNLFSKNSYDLCILDVMMPKLDGFTVAQKIREVNKQIPILFLTAKSTSDDKIFGLKTGADDYITKPFSIDELVLRIEVFLKRKNIVEDVKRNIYKIGNTRVDFTNLVLIHLNQKTVLTAKEAQVLKFLIDNKDRVIRREEILKNLWGKDDYFMGRSLDVFISRLRKYLKSDSSIRIDNIHGVGFKFEVSI